MAKLPSIYRVVVGGIRSDRPVALTESTVARSIRLRPLLFDARRVVHGVRRSSRLYPHVLSCIDQSSVLEVVGSGPYK